MKKQIHLHGMRARKKEYLKRNLKKKNDATSFIVFIIVCISLKFEYTNDCLIYGCLIPVGYKVCNMSDQEIEICGQTLPSKTNIICVKTFNLLME